MRNLTRTTRILALAAVGMLTVAMVSPALASDRKLNRQINLMERAIDDMLVESPNWLVQSSDNTRGVAIDGRGALFLFEASLVGSKYRGNSWFGGNGWWDDDDDHRVIILDDEKWDDEDWDDEDFEKDVEEFRARDSKRQARLFDRGKLEIVDVLMDFGDILTALDDSDVIEVEARLKSSRYFKDNDIRRLKVTAKMSDVRAYADEQIDEEAFESRVTMVEED